MHGVNSLPTSSGGANNSSTASPLAGPDSASLANASMTSGGMRGIGIVALLLAQITLKLETVKLAKGYYRTTKQDFDLFKATHQPGVVASISEAMSPIQNPTYEVDLYASAPAGISKSKVIDKAWYAARRRIHRYATGAQQRLDYDMSVLRVAAVATGWNMGRRYEMAWAQAYNERSINKKIAMGNLGVGVGNIVRQGLATAVSGLSSAQSGLSSTIGSIGNGYYEKQGYEQGRKETRERINNRMDEDGA